MTGDDGPNITLHQCEVQQCTTCIASVFAYDQTAQAQTSLSQDENVDCQ